MQHFERRELSSEATHKEVCTDFSARMDSICAKHDETIKTLDDRWREERDFDRQRSDTRESQLKESFDKLVEKLGETK